MCHLHRWGVHLCHRNYQLLSLPSWPRGLQPSRNDLRKLFAGNICANHRGIGLWSVSPRRLLSFRVLRKHPLSRGNFQQ